MDLLGLPRAMVAGIFEAGDTVPDLALALRNTVAGLDGLVTVVRGEAIGTDVNYRVAQLLAVPRPTTATTRSNPSAIAGADVNRDGRTDLIVTDEQNDTVLIFLAQSNGSYGSSLIPEPLVGGARPVSMAVGDIDGDGRPDVVVADAGRDPVRGGVSILVSSRQPNTPTPLPTATVTLTAPATASFTASVTATFTPEGTATTTPTPTRTRSLTPLPSPTPTKTLKPGTFNLSSCSIEPLAERKLDWIPYWGAGALICWRRRWRKANS
jgi:hypothetical protein